MALSELQILFRRCLHRRISAEEFRDILKQYKLKQKVKSRELVSTYIYCCLDYCVEGDPLLSGYFQTLLLSHDAFLIDFVTALFLQWKNLRESSEQQLQRIIPTQTRILSESNMVLAANADLIIDKLQDCVILTARWLATMAKWAGSDRHKDNIQIQNWAQVVGILLMSLLNFNTATRSSDIYNAVQQALDSTMGAFHDVSMALLTKLNMMVIPTQNENVEPHMMEMAALQFEEGVMETPVVATRSATVALVQHLLSTGATIDDSVIYSFLNTRHSVSAVLYWLMALIFQNNHAVMFNDLVFASVDAMMKPLSDLYLSQCQLFVLNKLPIVLSIIVTSSFENFSSEQNLIDAWNYVIAASPDSTAVMRRFLHICAFHHLISPETATTIAGEETTLKGLYAKDDLIAQVTANHTRGPRLVDELLKNDGNAGSISQAIYEVSWRENRCVSANSQIMNNYCHMRETQHLKDMANTIVRKPASINAIGMCIKPAVFLTSFCTLLDEWKWDEIHGMFVCQDRTKLIKVGESQPVYDEFGSVFLLILAFKQRLRLTDSEIGIQQRGFLAKYLSSKNTEQIKLSDTTDKYLGDWIKALYIDEGLSDELTTSCSAQDFYMLLPTLLRQSVSAHLKGKLSYDTLKAGLEYLLEPFLLPSLLPAFGWIKRVDQKTAQLVLQILVKPPGAEAREIHQTLLAMAGDQLHMDLLPKTQFAMDPPVGDLTQIQNEIYVSLKNVINMHGSLQVVRMLVAMLLENFHTLLDFISTIIVVNDLRVALQVLHGKVSKYLKDGDNLSAEAIVHLSRRVELYASTLTPQDMGMEPFVPLNVTNVNLDVVPETFQQPEQNEDIDQVLNEAAMGMDQLDNTGLDDMYGLQANDFGLGNLDDLDLDMF